MSLTLDQALTALAAARAKALSHGMRASFVVLGQGEMSWRCTRWTGRA